MTDQDNRAPLSSSESGDAATLSQIAARLELLEYRIADLQHSLQVQMSRQVVTLDEGFIGMRCPTGWLVLGQEEFRAVLHLADGCASHEPGTTALLQRLIGEGDTVIDVGAHIGLMSLPMAHAVGASGKLIAIEPFPRSAEALRRTLVANGVIDRCLIYVVAISDTNGVAAFYEGSNSMLGSLTPDRGTVTRTVDTRTLDSIISQDVRLDLVKIDAEGAELAVLRGMTRVIAENPNLIIIAEMGLSHLARNGQTIDAWLKAFSDAGLTHVRVIDEQSGTCRLPTESDLTKSYSLNLVFMRPENPRASVLERSDPVSLSTDLLS